MSADNYYVVRIHPSGGFTYVMGFASDEEDEFEIPVEEGRFGWGMSFLSVKDAFQAACEDYSEYGVSVHPECEEYW